MLTVVKIGGNVIDDPQKLADFLTDFAALEGFKILVHGGGKLATRFAERLGVPVKMHEGRRITDTETLEIITMVYGGLINKQIVAQLQARDCNALGIIGADLDLILASKRPIKNGIDYGWAGDVQRVDQLAFVRLIEAGAVPVVAPITHDGQGQLLNTNSDTIASAIASALSGHFTTRLVYCFDKKGVLTHPEDENSLLPKINRALFEQYKAQGIISAGMIPKMENAFVAAERGVEKVIVTRSDALAYLDSVDNFIGTVVEW
ncbi:MAG: acetylglutamate kinase [Cytophagales bacterium]|nr:acetylglutamate kinase [Bernardetiaceae bacterium]MDW8210332.1 acetylglutamate kinase [Cytophagales bacterium]